MDKIILTSGDIFALIFTIVIGFILVMEIFKPRIKK